MLSVCSKPATLKTGNSNNIELGDNSDGATITTTSLPRARMLLNQTNDSIELVAECFLCGRHHNRHGNGSGNGSEGHHESSLIKLDGLILELQVSY